MTNVKRGSRGGSRAEPERVDMKPLYLEALTLVERLHRRLLDVIKDEFDRSGRSDVNAVQALLLFNIGESELTAGRIADPRLLSRLQRVLQSEEAGRDGLHPSPALADGPSLRPGQPDRQGPRGRRDRQRPVRAPYPVDRTGRRYRDRRTSRN